MRRVAERMKLVKEFEVSGQWFGHEEEQVENIILKILKKIKIVKEAIIDRGQTEVVIVRAVAPRRYKLFVIVVDKGTWKARVYTSRWIPNDKIAYISSLNA